MPCIPALIDELRLRKDVAVENQKQSWLIRIPKSAGLVCEITIPFGVLEWLAEVRRIGEEEKLWSDWMDYAGYNNSPAEKLEAKMAHDIAAFIQRVTTSELSLPLRIYREMPDESPRLGGPTLPQPIADKANVHRAKTKKWRMFGLGLIIRLVGLALIWLGDGSDKISSKIVVGVGVVLSIGGIAVLRYLLISGFRRKK